MDSFNSLAEELRDFAATVVAGTNLEAPDLRRVLAFVAKVSQVAEQALQDVVMVLVDIKYLEPKDLNSSRIIDLQKQIELLTVRSRYRDVEEICSRLHHLSDQYRQQIAPLVGTVADAQGWHGMFGLLNEHEGRLINLVHKTTRELKERLKLVNADSLVGVNQFAAVQLDMVMQALDRLRELSNRILGVSGASGLLELTAVSRSGKAFAQLFLKQGDIHMGDRYEVGQAGAVGPGSHSEHNTFNQIWSKSSHDLDLNQLATELTQLRTALALQATKPDEFVALGEVASAEKAAGSGDGPGALEHLKRAGGWVWDTATKIGVGVATAAAKSALGL